MFWLSRETVQIAALKAEISDLRAALREERSQFLEERKALLDRIIALTAPGAYRVMNPVDVPRVAPDAMKQGRAIHFPGSNRSFRPPERTLGPDFGDVEPDVQSEPLQEEGG